MKFSHNIKKIRTDNNLTQEDLAQLLNVSRKTISSWETERSFPDIETLRKLSQQFEIPINQLLEQDLTTKKYISHLFPKSHEKSSLKHLCLVQIMFIFIGYLTLLEIINFPLTSLILLFITLVTYHHSSRNFPLNTLRTYKRNSLIFLIIALLINSVLGFTGLIQEILTEQPNIFYLNGAIVGKTIMVILLSVSMYILVDIRHLFFHKKRKL
ncbi:helix-turn-helix transcriptional regulator [Holzapfeliella sp. He02]|uniref:Helix-turn-helix transcriptional regulator n=1 Tax=Holzapfeliella saturejae TaxID=3082953 RepID=A0ABU8SHL4_9LACO